uniref:Uncharacterized protein n=1 Tax=Ixodes ricinus TaxID=34613 RepID=A0A6B0U255_IXORI
MISGADGDRTKFGGSVWSSGAIPGEKLTGEKLTGEKLTGEKLTGEKLTGPMEKAEKSSPRSMSDSSIFTSTYYFCIKERK